MLVWRMGEVWLLLVHGMSMWVVHVVQVLCLADMLGMRGVGGVCEMCMFGSGLCRRGVDNLSACSLPMMQQCVVF